MKTTGGKFDGVYGVAGQVSEIWHMPVTRFDELCISAVQSAATGFGYDAMEMVSGAGHDSLGHAGVAPAGMIFLPCENGISHNELENAKPVDIAAGCNVLLHAVLHTDNA